MFVLYLPNFHPRVITTSQGCIAKSYLVHCSAFSAVLKTLKSFRFSRATYCNTQLQYFCGHVIGFLILI